MDSGFSAARAVSFRVQALLKDVFFAVVVALAAAAFAAPAIAAEGDLQAIPPFGARVTDLTGTLDAQQRQSLEDELRALEQRKGSRVAVLMLATTQPEDIAAYSIRVTDAWKLSRSDGKTQDGVLLTIAKNDRRVRIDVGRDLEGAIPDAANARIIREYITPKFRANDYYGGIQDALGAITKLIDGESLPPPLTDERSRGGESGDAFNAAIFALFAILWARGMFGSLSAPPRGGLVGLVGAGAAWLLSGGVVPLAIGLGVVGLVLGLLGGGGGGFANRGGWGGFPGGFGGGGLGGGGGGGFGGGGFSGGSGGGFSGGGASGSW